MSDKPMTTPLVFRRKNEPTIDLDDLLDRPLLPERVGNTMSIGAYGSGKTVHLGILFDLLSRNLLRRRTPSDLPPVRDENHQAGEAK